MPVLESALFYGTGAVINDMPVWFNNFTYSAGSMVRASDGNYYRSQGSQAGNNPTSDDGTNWLPIFIFNGITLNVGSSARFTTIQAALSFLACAYAVTGATCTVQIANGTYSSTAVAVYGPIGGNVNIQGNFLNTSSVQIQVATNTTGIHIARDGVNCTIQYVTITRNTGATGTNGIVMDCFSDLTLSNVTIQNLGNGLYVTAGRTELVNAIGLNSNTNGIVIQEGAHLFSNSSSLTIGSNNTGVYASVCNGTVGLLNAAFTSNATYGIAAGLGGKVSCGSCSFTSNGTACFAQTGGEICLSSCTFTTNTTNYSPALNTFGNNGGLVRG
ncbi:hypothetical protein [Fimbriiglobus ruber]|uniref:hypothetical protein n=1 Tax=Fimbriiglobus ruber TaxID=1908690 RepID=UPI000B4B2351|nr:hypothetical protein [Fimbriiglobus ruber]